MLDQFLGFIEKEQLFKKDQKALLTVSGGVDSIVMCDLFHKAGLSFGIAHCNFKLRGKESDDDKKFVSELADKYKVPFSWKSFSTKPYAEKKKVSIQMAARELRYEWLKRLAKDKKYDFIATAHHLDDSIETFFINILRGTGIAGLQGVPVKQGIIIRPLLFANKKRILEYAESEKLAWREDSSNLTDKYLRNNIRHHLIPSLKKLNTGFEKTITKELSYFKDAAEIFKKFIEEKRREIVVEEGKNILLNIKKLKDSGHAETLLHELLRAYDFTPETTELIAKRMYTSAGKKFLSPTYRLIKDRNFLILSPHGGVDNGKAGFIKKNQDEFKSANLHLKIGVLQGGLARVKDKKNSVAYFDHDTVSFPLKIRKWKHGDSFHPLGMTGRKKLSDFFIDNKLPLSDKGDIYVLESDGNIIWVINHRIDDNYKVLPDTKNILHISILA
ncbi:MAG: tRNA lysidine(34) synthetase TilS [Bacteroidetes bacterium]|nr:MAG: tRNA lysidine(34) synthetase TilS [Bacteroidota bacterium]